MSALSMETEINFRVEKEVEDSGLRSEQFYGYTTARGVGRRRDHVVSLGEDSEERVYILEITPARHTIQEVGVSEE